MKISDWLRENDCLGRALSDEEMAALNTKIVQAVEWKKHTKHDGKERHFHCLHDDNDVTVWLLCWATQYGPTDIHGHGPSKACIYVVEGSIEETWWDGSEWKTITAGEGECFTIPEGHVHLVRNATEIATSIHVYSPGLHQMEIFDFVDGKPILSHIWKEDQTREEFC